MQETLEDGFEELNDANADDVDAILRAMVDVAAYGDKKVSRYASGLAAAWEQWLYEATPLSGTQCWPSTLQRKRALDDANSAFVMFAFHVRRSVGKVNARLWWTLVATPRPFYRADHPLTSDDDRLAPRQCLIDWRVRNHKAEIPSLTVGFSTKQTPWTSLEVQHNNFFTPLAAMAYKRKGSPWTLAIEGRLPDATIYELEKDAVRLITGNNGAWPMRLRANNWVAGEQNGDRVFLWMISDLEQRGLDITYLTESDNSTEQSGVHPNSVPFFLASSPAEAAEWINRLIEPSDQDSDSSDDNEAL
ncbi:hypothetical protein CH254_25445 [Rhodococcus sp. 06-412-2C]|nr:hypothetical protein CH254_25445 [Rhodococcus sp. 06-412-2C]OZC96035.1 hypothetical protein CH279_16635 [Rhodococcus sp. 06-412-2B]